MPGIAYRGRDNECHYSLRPLVRDLDSLPLPARDTTPLALRIDHEIPILASRGCVGRCRYCAIASFYRQCRGAPWRRRDPAQVAEELRVLCDQYRAYKFSFVDDDFLGPGSWAKSMPWPSLARSSAGGGRFALAFSADRTT